jgi:hypothetical protein
MSAYERPRHQDRVTDPDPQTSERLLDGREHEHPLADLLGSAGARPSARELGRETEAVHAFASRDVLGARVPTTPTTAGRARLGARLGALAAAFRPVPLAKALLVTTVAVVTAVAVANAVTSPADPVDSTSPADLTSPLEAVASTTTTEGSQPSAPGRVTPTGVNGPHKREARPPACAAWWDWAKRHQHTTWPTEWPRSWPTTWPADGRAAPSPTGNAAPPDTRRGDRRAGPDLSAWKACLGYWKGHRHHGGGPPETRGPGDGGGGPAGKLAGDSGDQLGEPHRDDQESAHDDQESSPVDPDPSPVDPDPSHEDQDGSEGGSGP